MFSLAAAAYFAFFANQFQSASSQEPGIKCGNPDNVTGLCTCNSNTV